MVHRGSGIYYRYSWQQYNDYSVKVQINLYNANSSDYAGYILIACNGTNKELRVNVSANGLATYTTTFNGVYNSATVSVY